MKMEKLMESEIGLQFDKLFEINREILEAEMVDVDRIYYKALKRFVVDSKKEDLTQPLVFRDWLFETFGL